MPRSPEEQRAYSRRWYAKNRERILAQRRDHYASNRDELLAYKRAWYERNKHRYRGRAEAGRLFLDDYLSSHPCVDCGEADRDVLEFDHVRGKRNNVTSLTLCSVERIVAEIELCDVVCANCHRRRTKRRARTATEEEAA